MKLMPLMDRRGDATAWADRTPAGSVTGSAASSPSFCSTVFSTKRALRLAGGMATTSGTGTVASSWFDRAPKSKTSMCLAQKGFHDPRCYICHRVIQC